MKVSVAERSSIELGDNDWRALSSDRYFWQLVTSKILQVDTTSNGRFRIRGTCYVGRALVGGRVLEIKEKFPGALAALARIGSVDRLRVERAPSSIVEDLSTTPTLVRMFLSAAKTYLSTAKVVQYKRIPDAGALVGGRLNIPRTAALRSRGMFHKVAFERTVLSADLPLNQCVYAALREIERLYRIADISVQDVAQARTLRLGLSECLASVVNVRRSSLAEIAATEAQNERNSSKAREAVALAGAILDAAGFGGPEISQRTIERSWFINLETFFEEAVRRVVGNILDGSALVSRPLSRPSLFRPSSGRYRANPDIVIRHHSGSISIADAKYKDFSDWPSSADVHEVISHAAAYGADKALLFFPDDSSVGIRSFGCAATGCSLWAAGISFDQPEKDILSGLVAAGLVTH